MLKRLRELLSDSAIYGASSFIQRIAGFLLLPLYTRYLDAADYGLIAMLAILTSVFPPIARLGMTNAIFRRFNLVKDEAERRLVLSTGLMSILVSTIVLCVIGLLLSAPLTKVLLGQTEFVYLIQLSLISAALATIGEAPMAALRVERRVKTIAALNILQLAVTITLTVWLVVIREQGVLGFVQALLAAVFVADVVVFWTTRRSFGRIFDRATWKSMASYGLPFVPHHVQAVGLAYFGQYVVAEMLSLEEAGRYNIALRFVIPLTFVVFSLQKAWVPFKFEVHATDKRPQEFFRSVVVYYLAVICYLQVGVSVWGPELTRLMTAAEFHAAASLVPIMAMIPVAQGLYFMLGTGIELTNDTRRVPFVSMAGLFAVVALSLITVPWLGAVGAAIASTIGWLTMAGVIYCLSQRQFQIDYEIKLLVAMVAIASTMAIGSATIQEREVAQRITFAVVVSVGYPIIALGLLLRSKTESSRVRAFLPRLMFWHAS